MIKTKIIFFLLLPIYVFAQSDDPFDVQLGEKLFNDDRFSHSFFVKQTTNINTLVKEGDPILQWLETPEGPVIHPHRGRQVSCASCHFVDQVSDQVANLVFAYNDFSPRSLVPIRAQADEMTLRNSMNMVLSSLEDGKPLHWDGEFNSTKQLACAALGGRNMGWLPGEENQARQHVVKVLREDSGEYPVAAELGGRYSENFLQLGYDFSNLSDAKTFEVACKVMGDYMKSLDFSRDEQGDFNGSAYDQFLTINGLRRGLRVGESTQEYLQYLRDQLNFKTDWKWLKSSPLSFHQHSAQFGPQEYEGMKVFFSRGQCVTCHTPPEFTDFGFHRIGISQVEYERLHGAGSFSKLQRPSWEMRNKLREKFFTATATHPNWEGRYAKIPRKENGDYVDLGLWNVLGHPDKQSVQATVRERLCFSERMPDCSHWSDDEYLSRSWGAFKTPTLRSLGQTAPYFHNGVSKDLLDVFAMYMATSNLARKGRLVDPDPMLRVMQITAHDFLALQAFMQALDEDYE